MDIAVEYIDRFGVTHNRVESITKLGLIKHIAVAGMGEGEKYKKINSFLGAFCYFSTYLNAKSLKENKFSLPKKEIYNPAGIAHFSNIVGIAIADFLSKRIDKSIFTSHYEAMMKIEGFKNKGSRPDLIAYKSNKERFAIEAKGFSTPYVKMSNHKDQSKKGPCIVNYSIASVCYNIYNNIKCKYHDPVSENFEFSQENLTKLSKEYYLAFGEILFMKINKELVEFQSHLFFAISLYELSTALKISQELKANLKKDDLYLLLSVDQIGFRQEITPEFTPFLQEKESESIYIDSDYIGLAKGSKIRSLKKNE